VNRIAYIAAHAGFPLDRVPLGGGASVADHLIQEWSGTHPFDLDVISPDVLGRSAPKEFDLVQMSEWRYARFCLAFERAATQKLLRDTPRPAAVLCNDVSEGPDFKVLAQAGLPFFTIYHVDVLDYVSRMYLRGVLSPQRLAAIYRSMESSGLGRCLPDIVQLVLRKQEHSVRYSRGLIVPSDAMKQVLLSCYPDTDPGRVHVLPWGVWEPTPVTRDDVTREKEKLRNQWSDMGSCPVLLTLSRLSPEKGQDRLLEALEQWEQEDDYPKQGIVCLIAGESAYMQGHRFKRKLERRAARLKRTRVYFPGYASGARKAALWSLADLYVFASRHESYGLTMMEALQAGVPVLCTPTHGVRTIFSPTFGCMTRDAEGSQVPEQLKEGLRAMLADTSMLRERGEAGRAFAQSNPFSRAAAQLAKIITPA